MRTVALALLLSIACAGTTSAAPLPRPLLAKIRAAERGDRLGVWESGDHLRDGHLEAGYSRNTDNVIVSVDEAGARRYYVAAGPGLEAHSVIVVPRRGDIVVRTSRRASEESWRQFVRESLGEKTAQRAIRVEPLR
jgi:hypothetical protein